MRRARCSVRRIFWPRYAISSLVGDEVLEVQAAGRDHAVRMERDPGRASSRARRSPRTRSFIRCCPASPPLLGGTGARPARGRVMCSDGVWALVVGQERAPRSAGSPEGSLVVCDDTGKFGGFAGPRAVRRGWAFFGDGESLGVLGERKRVSLEALASLPRLKAVRLPGGMRSECETASSCSAASSHHNRSSPGCPQSNWIDSTSPSAWYELERALWDALPRVARTPPARLTPAWHAHCGLEERCGRRGP